MLVPSNGPRAQILVASGGGAPPSRSLFSPTRNLNISLTYLERACAFLEVVTIRSSLHSLDSVGW